MATPQPTRSSATSAARVDHHYPTMAVTVPKRLLSLLECTALCAILHFLMAIGREYLGIGSWDNVLAAVALFIVYFTSYTAITIISVATYRWLVNKQKMEFGVGWEPHLFLSVGTPCLVTCWSCTESFLRIFGTAKSGGG